MFLNFMNGRSRITKYCKQNKHNCYNDAVNIERQGKLIKLFRGVVLENNSQSY
ncbi:hypothetical protein SDC9_182292 [bioreactor metagenome]|uniref:Uncharacterized protein n=1 Tax=bioreactor metagenome TaxID=1076179 RepID=A0A645H757_9ZZZZ